MDKSAFLKLITPHSLQMTTQCVARLLLLFRDIKNNHSPFLVPPGWLIDFYIIQGITQSNFLAITKQCQTYSTVSMIFLINKFGIIKSLNGTPWTAVIYFFPLFCTSPRGFPVMTRGV